jgi:predicted CXXCH cytochrome family protein
MLVATHTSPQSYPTATSYQAVALCIDACHDADGPGPDVAQHYESSGSFAGHRINYDPDIVADTSTAYYQQGDQMPCYECHNPHGSQRGNYRMMADELSDTTATTKREFCESCHRDYDSTEPTPTVAGMTMRKLPTNTSHASSSTADCEGCHEEVHHPNPAGVSQGGQDCLSCHSDITNAMLDSSGSSGYHHYLNTSTAATTTVANPGSRNCVNTCHVDHEVFNEPANKAANLRRYAYLTDNNGYVGTTTDFANFGGGEYGVCASCHRNVVTTTYNHPDKGLGANEAKIIPATYSLSSHNYVATSDFGNSYIFNANCSKCHNDTMTKTKQQSTDKYGTHKSTTKAIAQAAEEAQCYLCHTASGEASTDIEGEFTGKQSAHPITTTNPRVECSNCHNPHIQNATAKVANPDNTYEALNFNSSTSTANSFCLACHDGSAPSQVRNASTYVPYTVNVGSQANVNTYWTSSGHGTTSINEKCVSCHNSHSSNYEKLLTTTNDKSQCYTCHGSASSGYPETETTDRDSSGYFTTGTYPGSTTYNSSLHATDTGTIWPASGLASGDCKNCHAPHGTANTYDMTVSTFTATNFSLCLTCHDTDGPASNANGRMIKTYYVDSTDGNAGHQIKTSGGNLSVGDKLPCYDCHNPHEDNAYALRDYFGDANFDPTNATKVRNFCLHCHSDKDGDDYQGNPVGTETIEGLRRDGSDGSKLRLTAKTEHDYTDNTNCYNCHGNDYSSQDSFNVHQPSPGGSTGGQKCFSSGCHPEYTTMTYTNTSYGYHHLMTTDAAATSTAFSDTYRNCVNTCHVDHTFPNKSSNLRTGANIAGEDNYTPTSTDQSTSEVQGVCLSCHKQSRNYYSAYGVNRGRSKTITITLSDYVASDHNYYATSGFGTDVFYGNCVKCHNDNMVKSKQDSTYTFGTHISTTSSIISWVTEENLCYKCHSTAAQDNPNAPNDYYNKVAMSSRSQQIKTMFAKTYAHPVADAGLAGRHSPTEGTTSGWLPGSNRHVECTDCHNPHAAKSGTTTWPSKNSVRSSAAPPIAGANQGVWGVNISGASGGDWSGSGTDGNPSTPTYTRIATVSTQWQLCLKCHSTYGWPTSDPAKVPDGDLKGNTNTNQTDIGRNFNPKNYAYHPIFTIGRNQPPVNKNSNWDSSTIRKISSGGGLTNTFTDGWGASSRVVCTDCHAGDAGTSEPAGPHGSNNKWLLKGVDQGVKITAYDGTVLTSNNFGYTGVHFCLNCHRADVYGDGAKSQPTTNDQTLSRVGHLGGALRNKCDDATKIVNPVKTGCVNCHGGRVNDNDLASGAIHGSSMGKGDGDNSDGGVQNGTLVGDPMGWRFMNGATWDAHELATATGQLGCSTIDASDSYGTCTSHTGVWDQQKTPYYYY